MNIIFTPLRWALFFSFIFVFGCKKEFECDFPAVFQLVNRIVPDRADQFFFEKIPNSDDKDIFVLSTTAGKVHIKGNSAVSAASGLNWYLKYYCQANISWCGMQLNLPNPLPEIEDDLKI